MPPCENFSLQITTDCAITSTLKRASLDSTHIGSTYRGAVGGRECAGNPRHQSLGQPADRRHPAGRRNGHLDRRARLRCRSPAALLRTHRSRSSRHRKAPMIGIACPPLNRRVEFQHQRRRNQPDRKSEGNVDALPPDKAANQVPVVPSFRICFSQASTIPGLGWLAPTKCVKRDGLMPT